MKIDLIKKIEIIDNKKLYLPNSIFAKDNKLIVTDGGNNRVCIIDDTQEYSIGVFGIDKYKFKEPVYSMFFENKIFVCDWHNHRILEYKDKKFKNQIGIFGTKNENILKLIIKFILSLGANGSFIEKHFGEQETKISKKSNFKRMTNILKGISFYIFNISIFINNLMNKTYINKPNGCIALENNLIFTQKNNKCISVYDLEKKIIIKEIDNQTKGIDFGRLGQISYFDEKIYVCDEPNNLIWMFSKELDLIDKKSITKYNVFSISLDENYIATCGETGFSVFNHDFELLFEKIGDGEYHGVALDNGILYVCNRLENQIEQYKIEEPD